MESLTNFYYKAEELSVPGIYVYINNRSKEVFVSYSRNMLESMYRNIRDKKYRNCEVVLLESQCPIEQLKLTASRWMNEYKNKGYCVLNKVLPIKYKILIEVRRTFPHGKVEVILKPSRSEGKVLEVFTNMADAIVFAEQQKLKYCI